MAASLLSMPPVIGFSQEPMPVVIGTGNVAIGRAAFTLAVSGMGPQYDETILILWADTRALLTARGNPNNSGFQIPIPDPALGVNELYINELAEALRRNEPLNRDFIARSEMTALDTGTITLTLRYQAALTVFANNLLSNTVFTATPAQSAYLQPNLTALLRVEKPTGEELLSVLPAYAAVENGSIYTGQVTTDIRSAFDLKPHLPTFSAPMGEATDAYQQYIVRYADKYGAPPVAEALYKSDTHIAIFGGRSATSTEAFLPNTNGFYICHPTETRKITKTQNAWTYLFATQSFAGVTVAVRIRLINDPNQNYIFWVGTTFDIAANKLYYFKSDYATLSIEASAVAFNFNPSAIVGFDFLIADTLTSQVLLSVPVAFDSCRFDSLTLAYANGLGGIDTVNMRGGYTLKSEVERSVVRHYYANEKDTATGSFSTIENQGQGILEADTGNHPLPYAARLRQLLMGDVWLVDKKNQRFIKLIADTKSIEFKPQKRGLVSLKMQFKEAFTNKNFV